MTLLQKTSALFRRFNQSRKGTVAITYAITAVPLLIAVGAGVDYSRYLASLTEVQAALDAGALAAAAAKHATDTQRIANGEAAFAVNIQTGVSTAYSPSAEFTIVDGAVVASAEVEIPMAFLKLAGLATMKNVVSTEVQIASIKKAEIALVLDYSGSMEEVSGGQVKYVAMKNAATALVEDLEEENPDDVKFGLVPFSHHVYASLPGAYVVGGGAGTWTGCTQDRKYPNNLSTATPGAANATKWGHAFAPAHAGLGCAGYVDNHLSIRPLTDDFTAVKSQLAAMQPYAWTHIALGVEFGFHLLSPNAPFSEGASFADEDTEKYMVVLTDGQQTEPSFGPGSVRNVTQGEKNLVALCTNAKAAGITMITVAFDLDDQATKNRLQGCATDPAKHFFVAEDGGDIADAFQSIKDAITAEVFISK